MLWILQIKCREKLKELHDKNIIPVIVGGTGLYLKSALYDYKLNYEKDNETKYVVEVIAEKVTFLSSKKADE